MPVLTLYYKPACPYCQKVIHFMEQNGIQVEMKDINENLGYTDELISAGGRKQVPCLFIDDKPLYESDDIISWMRRNV